MPKLAESGQAQETVSIPLKLPSLNDYIDTERANRFKAAMLKRNTQADIMVFLRNAIQLGKLHRHENPVFMEYVWTEGNNRRDGDNIAFARKFIQDAMVEAGIFPDDSRRFIKGFSDEFKTENNTYSVTITIKEIEK